MSMYEDLEQGLLEMIEVKKTGGGLKKRENLPTESYYIPDCSKDLIKDLIEIRKDENLTQTQLAEISGYKQQAISRMENEKACPTLKFFARLIDAMGYDLTIVRKH